MPYAGLPPATIPYLAALEANNSRDWFEAHRAQYQSDWLDAGLDLIAALSVPASTFGLIAKPKLNASLRRIHRDVRFSNDKRPYDARLHLILSSGEAFNKVPGLHLVIGPDRLGYGAGWFGLPPEPLDRFRHKLLTPATRADFQACLDQAAQVGCILDPPDLARPPRGFEATDWDHLIRRKSVIVRSQTDQALPDWLFTAAAIEHFSQIIAALAPLIQWLSRL
jgi:uncharacterized protein (TIGR02453 family)